MKNPISIILILLGIVMGIYGLMKLDDSKKSVEVAGIEISAKDGEGRETAFILIGLGVVCLFGGVYASKRA